MVLEAPARCRIFRKFVAIVVVLLVIALMIFTLSGCATIKNWYDGSTPTPTPTMPVIKVEPIWTPIMAPTMPVIKFREAS